MGRISLIKILPVAHGASELILCESIKSNLRLPMQIEAEQKGRSSIQVYGLKKRLSSGNFSSTKSIFDFCNGRVEIKKSKIVSPFKIFPIMDLDDCSTEIAEMYKNGCMFDGLQLKEYIVPIYNSPNLDDVIKRLGFDFDPEHKRKSYEKVFPGISGDINAAVELYEMFRKENVKNGNTNMHIFIEACLETMDKKY